MVLTSDQELWGVALWVEKTHGSDGQSYFAHRVERLASEGDEAGIAMWQTVAVRFKQLRQKPVTDRFS